MPPTLLLSGGGEPTSGGARTGVIAVVPVRSAVGSEEAPPEAPPVSRLAGGAGGGSTGASDATKAAAGVSALRRRKPSATLIESRSGITWKGWAEDLNERRGVCRGAEEGRVSGRRGGACEEQHAHLAEPADEINATRATGDAQPQLHAPDDPHRVRERRRREDHHIRATLDGTLTVGAGIERVEGGPTAGGGGLTWVVEVARDRRQPVPARMRTRCVSTWPLIGYTAGSAR